MPRRRPARLRSQRAPTVAIPGVPLTTSSALDRLGRPEIGSAEVARALEQWRQVASLSQAQLTSPHNDWTERIGPMARTVLERALNALTHRQAAPLRTQVDKIDSIFVGKTLHNPAVDASRHWWERRSTP